MAQFAEYKKFHVSSIEEREVMKDPAKVACRIFVGNLPTDDMERSDLQKMFESFGAITGVLLNRGFGFVQFEKEESASDAIKNSMSVLYKGKKVDVKPARAHTGERKLKRTVRERSPEFTREHSPGNEYFDRGRDVSRYPTSEKASKITPTLPARVAGFNANRVNDCEIIVVNKKQTEYAEFIELKLKKLGLSVDLLFPNEEVPLPRVLANISSRGSLYAILIMPQNEDHRSLTLNILHGQPQEHRNMPLEDAINLLARNFDAYIIREKSSRPSEVNIVPAAGPLTAVNLTDRHPEAIQVLLNLVADNRQLTVLQYDKLITYLTERRELQLKLELGDTAPTSLSSLTSPSQQQQELQSRILSILNSKGTAAAPRPAVTIPVTGAASPAQQPILNNPNVQRALDSLMQTDVLRNLTAPRF